MKAIKAAQFAAQVTFDRYLRQHNSTATSQVPPTVIEAARAAYAGAGGFGKIAVVGRGNSTHPVCSVFVERTGSQ